MQRQNLLTRAMPRSTQPSANDFDLRGPPRLAPTGRLYSLNVLFHGGLGGGVGPIRIGWPFSSKFESRIRMSAPGRVLPTRAPGQSYRRRLQCISLQSLAAPMTGDTLKADQWSQAVPKAVVDPLRTSRHVRSVSRARCSADISKTAMNLGPDVSDRNIRAASLQRY